MERLPLPREVRSPVAGKASPRTSISLEDCVPPSVLEVLIRSCLEHHGENPASRDIQRQVSFVLRCQHFPLQIHYTRCKKAPCASAQQITETVRSSPCESGFPAPQDQGLDQEAPLRRCARSMPPLPPARCPSLLLSIPESFPGIACVAW